MTEEQKKWIADYFTTSDLVELLDIDTYELVCALEEFNGYDIFDDETVAELNEIIGIGY